MIYKKIIESKDGLQIPILENDKSIHSIYAPKREAENFATNLSKENLFTIIIGLGGGYHIESFSKKNQNNFILVIEESKDDIDFLCQIECVQKLLTNENILIISKDEIQNAIVNNYIPAIHNGVNILSNRQWIEYDKNKSDQIIDQINLAIKNVSRDFSVQAHFGLIWQKNIISNLKILDKLNNQTIKISNNKIAAIIAAGPSIDYTISKIKENPSKYFIIATDTALPIILKNNLECDLVISIDGQNISYKHFIGIKNISSTIFVFDLQANFNAVNYISKFTNKIIFTCSNHPFSEYANIEGYNQKDSNPSFNSFLKLTSGAGTVTIAAIDFAKKCGFRNIEVFGADFSYPFNKPYAKGTYLDELYRFNESKLTTGENLFSTLLFRTKINKVFLKNKYKDTNVINTEILDLYKESFLQWIDSNNFEYKFNDFLYQLTSKEIQENSQNIQNNFDYNKFINTLKNHMNLINLENKIINHKKLSNIEIAILPLISYIKNKYKNTDYIKSLKLAMSKILQYTYIL